MLPKLLVVDDDEDICTQMRWALAQHFQVFVAVDRPGALATFKKVQPAVVTLDLGLPPQPHGVEEGFCALRELLREDANTKVIVITGHEEHEHALTAIGQGAYDFFHKPIQLDELLILLRRALHVHQLEHEHRALQLQSSQDAFAGMLGKSPPMQEIFTAIRRVALTEVSVVVSGESGTGKELVARAIHQHSTRSSGPFITINCAAIPEPLLESELFGYEKGAFTGAQTQRKGRIELAQGGTLFLDEIGDLSPSLQVKLLRFLQEHQIERLGGRETIHVDVRVVAATNVNLEQAIVAGRFREDLYYRLSVIHLQVPPLRDREEDIIVLATAMLHRYSAKFHKKVVGFEAQALAALRTYTWPGNVRELENRLKRAVIMAAGMYVTPADLELEVPVIGHTGRTLKEAREAIEQDLIRTVLARHQGNVSRTAAELKVSRPTLHDLLAKYGIER